ncbi:hypothetical protein [Nonomuraea typhae]|uniref:hypothetical protein n=1 Tax=Nonomuraea typhae TaxID=2603600 RepID=UPI0012FAF76D|nr:hypothetical protein [Nonomuraea typhae]
MRDEQDLLRTLHSAADQARSVPGGLTEAVAARRRRRRVRQRAQVTLAAAAVVLVAGGTAVALSRGGGQPADPAAQATTIATAVPSSDDPAPTSAPPEHVTKLWPEAITKIPKKADNGWKYRVATALSPTEILLTTEKSFEKAGQVLIYDTPAKSARLLGEVPSPRKGYFAQDFVADDQSVAWWGETPNNDDVWADLWVIPRAGGEARQLKELTGDAAEIENLNVTADHVVWSARKGGVYRIPLAGGEPEKIQNSDDLHLGRWPWAYALGPGKLGERNHSRLVNLETGATIAVKVGEGDRGVLCTPEQCVGSNGDTSFTQRPDGSDRRNLPTEVGMQGPEERLEGDVIPAMGTHDAIPLAYDLKSDRIFSFGKSGVSYGRLPGVLWWDDDARMVETCDTSCTSTEKGGKEYTVVNLLAIPR